VVHLPHAGGCMQEAPAIKECDRSTRNVRADADDAGDTARVSLFLGRVVFARTKCFVHKRLHAFLVRLPSILLGYSVSRTRHVACMAAPLALTPRVLSEGGGTSPSSDVRHEIFSCFVVVSFRSNECRGAFVPRATGPAQHRTPRGVVICALPGISADAD